MEREWVHTLGWDQDELSNVNLKQNQLAQTEKKGH
jgi:hypothetical protein